MMKENLWPLPTTAALGFKVGVYEASEFIDACRDADIIPEEAHITAAFLTGLGSIGADLVSYFMRDRDKFSEVARIGRDLIRPTDLNN